MLSCWYITIIHWFHEKVVNYSYAINADYYCCNVILNKELVLEAEAIVIRVHSKYTVKLANWHNIEEGIYMLTMIDIGIDNAVAFTLSGKVTEDDMNRVLMDAEAKTVDHGGIVIYEEIESFSGIELAAIVEELKYLVHAGLKHIKQVAVVADARWIEKVVKVEDTLFRDIDIQYFTFAEKPQAITFLQLQ